MVSFSICGEDGPVGFWVLMNDGLIFRFGLSGVSSIFLVLMILVLGCCLFPNDLMFGVPMIFRFFCGDK